jgi:hypothetical protein
MNCTISQHVFCVDLRGLLKGYDSPFLVFTKDILEASKVTGSSLVKIRMQGFYYVQNGGGLAASRRFSHFIHHSPNTNSTVKPSNGDYYWDIGQT